MTGWGVPESDLDGCQCETFDLGSLSWETEVGMFSPGHSLALLLIHRAKSGELVGAKGPEAMGVICCRLLEKSGRLLDVLAGIRCLHAVGGLC